MKTPTTINDLDVKTIRKLKEQLVSAEVKPNSGGMFFLVTTKKQVRSVMKQLGFTPAEIKEVMTRVTKVEELK